MFCIVESQKLWEKLHEIQQSFHDIRLLNQSFLSIPVDPSFSPIRGLHSCRSVWICCLQLHIISVVHWIYPVNSWVSGCYYRRASCYSALLLVCTDYRSDLQIWLLLLGACCLVLHLLPRVLVDNGGSCHTSLFPVAWCLQWRCFSCAVL